MKTARLQPTLFSYMMDELRLWNHEIIGFIESFKKIVTSDKLYLKTNILNKSKMLNKRYRLLKSLHLRIRYLVTLKKFSSDHKHAIDGYKKAVNTMIPAWISEADQYVKLTFKLFEESRIYYETKFNRSFYKA